MARGRFQCGAGAEVRVSDSVDDRLNAVTQIAELRGALFSKQNWQWRRVDTASRSRAQRRGIGADAGRELQHVGPDGRNHRSFRRIGRLSKTHEQGETRAVGFYPVQLILPELRRR